MEKETTDVALRYITLIDNIRVLADFIACHAADCAIEKILPNGDKESSGASLIKESLTNVYASPGQGYSSTYYLGFIQVPLHCKDEIIIHINAVNDLKLKMSAIYTAYLKAGGQTSLVNDEYLRIASEANSSRWHTQNRLPLKPPFIKHAARALKWVVEPDIVAFYARRLRRVEKVTDKKLKASLDLLSDDAREIAERKIAGVRDMSALRYIYDGKGVAYKSRVKTEGGWVNQSASLPMIVISDYPFEYKSIKNEPNTRNARSDAGGYKEILPEIRIYEQTR